MNPLKHKMANEWMRQDDASPQEALDTWNTMEAEFKLNRAMSQEPRTMAQEPRIGLATGSVSGDKAEFSKAWKDYNKSYRFSGPKGIKHRLSGAEFFKIWAKENMADGGSAGQLVRNTAA